MMQDALSVALEWLRLFQSYAPVVGATTCPPLRLQNWQRLAEVCAAPELAAAIALLEEAMQGGYDGRNKVE